MRMRLGVCAFLLLPFGALISASGQSIPSGALGAASGAGSNACFTAPAGTHWWKTKEGSGTTLADSLSGDSATLANIAWTGAVSPLLSMLDYSGSNPYALLTSNPNYGASDHFSVSAWVTSTGAAYSLVASDLDGTNNYAGFEWGTSPNGDSYSHVYFSMLSNYATSNGLQVYGDNTCSVPADGSVHMETVTYDGSSSASGVKMYLDGAPCATVTTLNALTGAVSSTTAMALGNRNTGYLQRSGKLGNIAMVPRVLTSSEVSCLHSHPYGP